jgi:two-component system, OmpR family, response regulator
MPPPLEKLLLVEDEPDIQTIARMALEMVGGFRVEVCGSGREALAAAPRFKPDLVLLDVMMPEMDGPTTLERLRELPEFGETPVVFITAKAMPTEIEHFKAIGAADIIPKPFDPMALADRVREIWNAYHG